MSVLKRKNKFSLYFSGIAVALFFLWLPNSFGQALNLQPTDSPVPESFFGMHILHHFVPPNTVWPSITFGSWRLWDTYTTWPDIESSKGRWNFENLDKYVALAEEHHVEVLLTLAFSPHWASTRADDKGYGPPGAAAEPKDIADWQNYVRTVATRYKGRIHNYEIWNEPNLKGYYSGSAAQLVQLALVAYKTLKQIDPTIVVSSPPPTGANSLSWFDEYLKAGGGKYADVIGYHLYVNPEPPEEMVPLIEQVKQIMRNDGVGDKPLWDTETGWAIQNRQSVVKPAPGRGFNSVVLSEDVAAAYMARAFVLSWASGVSRLYWYAWDNWNMGLVDRDGRTLKLPAIAYGEVENWLVGATMTSCGSDAAGTWTCSISRNGGYRGWIMWNPTAIRQLIKLRIPATWHVDQMRDLLGRVTPLSPGATVEVSYMPRLLEASGK
jgi:Glycosyl hydrolases family 39